MCFSTAAASRPVQPAMISRRMVRKSNVFSSGTTLPRYALPRIKWVGYASSDSRRLATPSRFNRITRKDLMLPGLRLILAAISATILVVVLAFMQLVKLHVAQDHSSNPAPVEARFAGLAFAPRADWTPVPSFRSRSLESLPPFDKFLR
jgi:hypothetical protein